MRSNGLLRNTRVNRTVCRRLILLKVNQFFITFGFSKLWFYIFYHQMDYSGKQSVILWYILCHSAVKTMSEVVHFNGRNQPVP
jgi:uncharacterized membrane protein (DUF106 family)